MLHMEIVQERLEREYNLDLISTAPTVIYEVVLTNGEKSFIHSPSELPPINKLAEIREPIIVRDDSRAARIRGQRDYLVHGKARDAEKHAVHGQPSIADV